MKTIAGCRSLCRATLVIALAYAGTAHAGGFQITEISGQYQGMRNAGAAARADAAGEDPPIAQPAPVLHVEDADVRLLGIVDIEQPLVRREAQPVRHGEEVAVGHQLGLVARAVARRQAEHPLPAQVARALDAEAGVEGSDAKIGHGSVVIAAITSCTNTSNPSVLVAAGLLAKKAVEKGLKTPSYVKTSLAPGSRVVTSYLEALGLDKSLEALGFFTVGYGCTTCIGNSGPLPDEVRAAIDDKNLVAASVLSGNRNFEGRINPDVKANYLASPPLVVAYAIAGRVDVDLAHEPLGVGSDGADVYLKDIWPSMAEVQQAIQSTLTPEMFRVQYANTYTGNETWNAIQGKGGDLYQWDEDSTYIQEPPFFEEITPETKPIQPVKGMRALLKLGDSVTTDHISPAGSFASDTPAGEFLLSKGVRPKDFNSYGSRRGNDRVMTRGTFANIRIRNQLAPGTEGGFTKNLLNGEVETVYAAAQAYKKAGVPLIVLAGKEYGTGSSRDWAAKGTLLLGVKAVLAESYERIHRSNLVFMGVLPLQFKDGENAESLGLTGQETFDLPDLNDDIQSGQELTVIAKGEGGEKTFKVKARIDTPVEVSYYRNGGILHTVLRQLAAS